MLSWKPRRRLCQRRVMGILNWEENWHILWTLLRVIMWPEILRVGYQIEILTLWLPEVSMLLSSHRLRRRWINSHVLLDLLGSCRRLRKSRSKSHSHRHSKPLPRQERWTPIDWAQILNLSRTLLTSRKLPKQGKYPNHPADSTPPHHQPDLPLGRTVKRLHLNLKIQMWALTTNCTPLRTLLSNTILWVPQ